jgi:hypothetical protein
MFYQYLLMNTPLTQGMPLVDWFTCLHEDILHAIFEHFPLHPGSKSERQARIDLLSAGMVCKNFSEPALKALWRILPSLIPLLLLLPSAKVVDGQFVSYRS